MPDKKYSCKVSVCLLSYNHGHLLSGVIDSILRQSISDYEIIITDDCSTDNSWNIIQEYVTRYNQIRAVKTPSNIGMPGNLNYGASYAGGEYLAILHHDDLLDERLLEKWVAIAEKTGAAFVFNEYIIDGVESHKSENRLFTEKMDGKCFLKKCLLGGWGCPVRGTALVRRDCFIAVGGVDTRFGLIADVNLWMKLAAQWDVGYAPEPLIKVFHNAPDNYPKSYTEFSWTRRVTLYDIHANNIHEDLFCNLFFFKLYWLAFRIKVSVDVLKWYMYAIVKKKRQIVVAAQQSENHYEFFFVRYVRNILTFLYLRLF